MDYTNELLAHVETKTGQSNSAFNWTKKVIESSYNSYHVDCCKKLIELYQDQYNDEHLTEELEAILYRKSLMILLTSDVKAIYWLDELKREAKKIK